MNRYKTFHPTNNNQLLEPMFFGQPVNVARFDQQRHPAFEKLTETQLSFFWRPEEVDLSKDRTDYDKMEPHEQHIFTSNLKYQTLLDSVQGRGPTAVLLPICSLPELEAFIEAWSFFESIHARSYTHILRNLLPDPTEFFDDIVPNPEIMVRAQAVTKFYDDLYEKSISWRRGEIELTEVKKALILCIASINILEGIRFYGSFACSFAFAERKLMEGNAKVIKLIARDEAIHLAATQQMMRIWREGRDDLEMKGLMEELKPEIRQIMIDAIEQEKDWAEYLFKDGSMLGLNKKILVEYLEHIADKRLKALGIETEYGDKKNPIPWINNWLQSDDVQVAPQETEISAYLTGQVDSTVNQEDLGGLSL